MFFVHSKIHLIKGKKFNLLKNSKIKNIKNFKIGKKNILIDKFKNFKKRNFY